MNKPVYRAQQAAADAIHEDWGSLSWKASAKVGNAHNLTLGHVTIKTGQKNPRHGHNTTEEVLYLLKGKLRHTLGDQEYILEAGDTLHIPAGVFHDAESIGQEDAEMIVAYGSATRDFVLADKA